MEELKEFCEAGMPVTLSSSWHEFNTAKQLLTSQGYKQVTGGDEEAEDAISFIKQEIAEGVLRSPFTFPSEVPQLECTKPRAERSDLSSDSEWKACPCFQLDTSKLPHQQVRIDAHIPKLSVKKQQNVGIKLLVQPFAKIDEAQLYIKLRIETLIVGVVKEFLTDSFSLGYYPYIVKIMLEPEVAGSSDLVAIPIYTKRGIQDHQIDPAPSAIIKNTLGTTVSAQLGFGPVALGVQYNRGMEWESNRNKQLISFDAVDSDGNAASFEWSILRWKNEAKYKPHSTLPHLPRLPFLGTAPKLEGFPDIVWRFKRGVKDHPLKFLLCLDVQMHLVWFLGNSIVRSTGCKSDGFQYRNQVPLELPQSIQSVK